MCRNFSAVQEHCPPKKNHLPFATRYPLLATRHSLLFHYSLLATRYSLPFRLGRNLALPIHPSRVPRPSSRVPCPLHRRE